MTLRLRDGLKLRITALSKKYKKIINRWKADFDFRTVTSSALSFTMTTVFAFYNGIIGLLYGSLWNLSIAAYYFLLSLVRGVIMDTERSIYRSGSDGRVRRRRTAKLTSWFLLLMTVLLIVPVTMLAFNKAPVDMSLIPAIGMAAYTSYKIVFASINLHRKRLSENILIRELRNINFIDALISILTLQNTLLVINNSTGDMYLHIISVVTSATALVVIMVITVEGALGRY